MAFTLIPLGIRMGAKPFVKVTMAPCRKHVMVSICCSHWNIRFLEEVFCALAITEKAHLGDSIIQNGGFGACNETRDSNKDKQQAPCPPKLSNLAIRSAATHTSLQSH